MKLEDKLEISFLITLNEEDYRIISFDRTKKELYLMTIDGFDEKTININELPNNFNLYKLEEV